MDPVQRVQISEGSSWGNTSYVEYVNAHMNLKTPDLDLFLHCWRRQTCESCLHTSRPCSWCATSQACVPNEVFDWPFAILAPIKTEHVCPLGWRGTLGDAREAIQLSVLEHMTFVSVVVAVVGTLVGVLLLWLLVRIVRLLWRKWRKREEGWWKFNHWRPGWTHISTWHFRRTSMQVSEEEAITNEEQRPLLAT